MTQKKKASEQGSKMKETAVANGPDAAALKDEGGESAKKSKKAKANPAPQASGNKPPVKQAKKGDDKLEAQKSKKKDEESEIAASIKDMRQFLKEVQIEFLKISWPTRPQVIQETYSVLFLVAVITLMVLAFDWFIGSAIFGPLEHWARLHGGGVGHG